MHLLPFILVFQAIAKTESFAYIVYNASTPTSHGQPKNRHAKLFTWVHSSCRFGHTLGGLSQQATFPDADHNTSTLSQTPAIQVCCFTTAVSISQPFPSRTWSWAVAHCQPSSSWQRPAWICSMNREWDQLPWKRWMWAPATQWVRGESGWRLMSKGWKKHEDSYKCAKLDAEGGGHKWSTYTLLPATVITTEITAAITGDLSQQGQGLWLHQFAGKDLAQGQWKIIHWPHSPVNPHLMFVSSHLNAKTSPTVQCMLTPALLYMVRGHVSLTTKVAKGSKGEMGSGFSPCCHLHQENKEQVERAGVAYGMSLYS